MADQKQLEHRLIEIGCNFRFFARPEIRELGKVLMPNEIVEHCVIGTYQGGFALLVATDQRVLLIDKKPFYLTLEDTRYDMITEIDFNHHLFDANVYIRTPNKSFRFVAYNQGRLRKLFHFVQTRVMEIRQHYQQAAASPAIVQQQLETTQYRPVAASSLQANFEPYFAQPGIDMGVPGQTEGQVTYTNMITQPSQFQPQMQPTLSHQGMQQNHPVVYHTVAPIISAYTRLPMMSRQRRFLGSRAVNAPTMYFGQ